MTSRPKKREEGFVACSPVEWAQMVLHALNIADKDPQKNEKLWEYGIKEHVFSSGSDLTKEDYLRLRVLWYTWPEQSSFRNYMRDNPALIDEEQNSTPYTGYINPNNDEIAEAIYTAIRPEIGGYLSDIERVGREDATRPSSQCGIFWMTRYWQGLLAAKLKEVYDEDDKKRHFRGKVRKSEAGLPQPAGPSRPPQTPTKQKQTRQPHEGFGTPAVDRAGASAGGLQNPATADETYVNTALLLMLQTITRLMTDLEEKHRIRSNPSNRSPSTVNSQPGSRTGSRERERASPAGSQVGSRSGNVDQASRETSSRPGSQQSSRAHSSTNIKSRDDKRERSPDPIAVALSQVRGLRHLDWLADRLALNLMDRSPAPASRPSKPSTAKKLMEARVDGYLCRRDFVQSSGDDAKFYARFNKYPLAILEAKPFTRMSALSAIRWQESAEIASWVSGLDDAYENAGLLRSSTSGRKRRLLISQDRHELWIIIAEYGDEWKHYIRGKKTTRPANDSQSQEIEDLAGSEGFLALARDADPDGLKAITGRARNIKENPGSTRTSRGPDLQLPGPQHFCIMQQWGPYKTGVVSHMDFFIRRVIGLQIELLQNWPLHEFPHPDPR